MEQRFWTIRVATKGVGLYEITDRVTATVNETGFGNALVNISVPHTSCSLLIQENASPDVQSDLISFFSKIAPMSKKLYQHDIEGVDDMPAHLKTSLTQTNLTLSVIDRKLILGKWQGIFVFEHRLADHTRKVAIHVMGDKD